MTLALLRILACFLVVFSAWPTALCNDAFQELTERSAKSPVIPVTSESEFLRFIGKTKRSYSLLIFCNAVDIPEAKSLRLKSSLENFKLVAKKVRSDALRDGPSSASSKLFFLELDLKVSKMIFMSLGVTNLPWVVHISPDARVKSDGRFNIHQDEHMTPSVYGAGLWEVKSFRSFVNARAHVDIPHIPEPSPLNDPIVLSVILLLLIPSIFGAWKVYTSSWIGSPWIWSTLSLAVFTFAASGGMHNIIRGVPLVSHGRNGIQWYRDGSGQLGMEGFVVGGMYVLFSLCCFCMVSLPKVLATKGMMYTRVFGWGIMLASTVLFFRIVHFYRWKTGYHIRFYISEVLGLS